MVKPTSIRELRDSGYTSRSVKQELRDNLIARLRSGEGLFPGIVGYEETVIPQIENAILSGQDIIFLGERGQAKTRMARLAGQPARRGGARRSPAARSTTTPTRPICAGVPARWWPSRATTAEIDVDPARPPLRREAGHPRHHHRRPDRRGRPDQGGRGALPLRRADHPLRPAARAPTAASSASTSCPTWPSASRWACSTSWKSATCRSAATRCACRSTSTWWPAPTPRTTRTAGASSRRSRTASARRSAPTTRRTLEHEIDIMEQERAALRHRRATRSTCPQYMKEIVAEITHLARAHPDISQRSGVSVRVSICQLREPDLATRSSGPSGWARRVAAPRVSDLRAARRLDRAARSRWRRVGDAARRR